MSVDTPNRVPQRSSGEAFGHRRALPPAIRHQEPVRPPRGLLAPRPVTPPGQPSAATALVGSVRLDRDTRPEERSDDDFSLWFRDNIHPAWVQLSTLEEARRLVEDRTEGNPWLTVCGTHHFGGDAYVDSSFEVLGDNPERMYVCGDVDNGAGTWFWSSWALPYRNPGPVSKVGPAWYSAEVYDAQIQTLDDALAQLEPALRVLGKRDYGAPGYWWRDRIHDFSPLTHIRSSRERD